MRTDVFGQESSGTKGGSRRESPSDGLEDKCIPGKCLTESSHNLHNHLLTDF